MGGVDPARAKYVMPAAGRGDRPLPGELCRSVHRPRPRLVGFAVAVRRRAVEHVVGGVVNENRILSGGLGGDRGYGRGINQLRAVWLALGPIHGRVGSGVDDHRRPLPGEQGHDLFGPLEIGRLTVAGQDVAQSSQHAAQLTAHLPSRSQNHDLHDRSLSAAGGSGGSGRR